MTPHQHERARGVGISAVVVAVRIAAAAVIVAVIGGVAASAATATTTTTVPVVVVVSAVKVVRWVGARARVARGRCGEAEQRGQRAAEVRVGDEEVVVRLVGQVVPGDVEDRDVVAYFRNRDAGELRSGKRALGKQGCAVLWNSQ